MASSFNVVAERPLELMDFYGVFGLYTAGKIICLLKKFSLKVRFARSNYGSVMIIHCSMMIVEQLFRLLSTKYFILNWSVLLQMTAFREAKDYRWLRIVARLEVDIIAIANEYLNWKECLRHHDSKVFP